MEFIEHYLDGDELDFVEEVDLFEALDYINSFYDSDQMWYSGTEDFSDSLDSVDWDHSEWMDNDELRLLGSILNNEHYTWRYQLCDTENKFFPIKFHVDNKDCGTSSPEFPSLMDLSAKVASQHFPYSYIQRMYAEIPEQVAKKLMLWSFPKNVTDIYRYWLNPSLLLKYDPQYKHGCDVERLDQFGFLVQGRVTFLDETHTASLICDRCTIITVSCSCKDENILWCRHVVAVALCRIQYANVIQVNLPIYDSISKLNRDQLQKLLQYLVCDANLPTVKRLQSEIFRITTNRSLMEEIEDVTAPVIYEGKPRWFLEPVKCNDMHTIYFMSLLRKALKMCKAKDGNGMTIIKDLLLSVPNRNYGCVGPVNKTFTTLISVTSSPILSYEEKKECCATLKDQQSSLDCTELNDSFSNDTVASVWRNNIHYISCKKTRLNSAAEDAKKSMFYLPLAAIDLSWDDKILRKILKTDITMPSLDVDLQDCFWFEHFPTSCARIEVLYNNGYEAESIRLAVVIIKSIMLQIKRWKQAWINALHDETVSQTKMKVQQLMSSASESWLNQTVILHKMDPVAILFSFLTKATKILNSISKDNHLMDENDYVQLAVEALFVILSQQLFPKNMSDQYLLREFYQAEAVWLRAILSILLPKRILDDDETDQSVLIKWKPDGSRIRTLFKLLADAGPFTAFGKAADYFIPRYQWGYLTMAILYHIDKNLAKEVGWKCLKYPFYKAVHYDYEEEYTFDHIKLVTFLIALNDGDSEAIDKILDAAEYMKNACKSMLFIKEFKSFILQQPSDFPEITACTKNMIFKRILKALKSEKKTNAKNSEINVTSLFEFAATIGPENIIEVLTKWNDFFDISRSFEILQHCDWAKNIPGLHPKTQTALVNAVYDITLQCIASGTVEDHLMFDALIVAQETFQFTETQKKFLRNKNFALGISCSALQRHPDILYVALSRLANDDEKYAAFGNFVTDAIKKNKVTPHKLFFYSQQEQAINKSSAFNLGTLAVQHLLILPSCQYGGFKVNFETNSIADVFKLAIDLGEGEITKIVSLVMNNVKHDAVLCDLTTKFHDIVMQQNKNKPEWFENFIIDVMGVLQQSLYRRSRRLRSEINFANHLRRTKHVFLLANDGWTRFSSFMSMLKPMLPNSKRRFILKSIGMQAEI